MFSRRVPRHRRRRRACALPLLISIFLRLYLPREPPPALPRPARFLAHVFSFSLVVVAGLAAASRPLRIHRRQARKSTSTPAR